MKVACFLKVKQAEFKWPENAVKVKDVSTAFCKHKKLFVKNYAIKKKDLLNSYLLGKSASILGGVFERKWGPFCPISADTLKIHPEKNGPYTATAPTVWANQRVPEDSQSASSRYVWT